MRWPRSRHPVRRLNSFDRNEALSLLASSPVETVLLRAAYDEHGIGMSSFPVGHFRDGEMVAIGWIGGNIIPFNFDESGLDELADFIRDFRPASSSIVGPADQVLGLWERLKFWGRPARDIRECQYSMVFEDQPGLASDPLVRPASIGEGNLVLPASVAMFTEEVGYDPLQFGDGYAQRTHSLIRDGRTFVRMGPGPDGPRVEFKADVGALAGGVAQIQGVWTAPDLRGQGIATAAIVSAARLIQQNIAPTVSLYVNDYNHAAVRVYEKAGFTTVGEFATILF